MRSLLQHKAETRQTYAMELACKSVTRQQLMDVRPEAVPRVLPPADTAVVSKQVIIPSAC